MEYISDKRFSIIKTSLERIFMHKGEQMVGPLSGMEQRTKMCWLPGQELALLFKRSISAVDCQTKETGRLTFLFCQLVAFSYLSYQILLVELLSCVK